MHHSPLAQTWTASTDASFEGGLEPVPVSQPALAGLRPVLIYIAIAAAAMAVILLCNGVPAFSAFNHLM